MDSSKEQDNINNYKVVINVIAITCVLLVIYYCIPYFSGEDMDESYAPDRERTDPQSDWNITEEIRAIRAQQHRNLSSLSSRSCNL